MSRQNWQEHTLRLEDHEMAWYGTGHGPTVLFLNGCYDNSLYRALAELFAHRYRCILYDQRGSGGSVLKAADDRTLHVDRFVDDIEHLRAHLGLEKLSVVGHSWGATLAVLYGGAFPQRTKRLVLIGMGPLSKEMHAVYRANVLRAVPPADRVRWDSLTQQYSAVVRRPGAEVSDDVDEEHARLWSRVMTYSPEAGDRFVGAYLRAGGYRRRAANPRGLVYRDIVLAAGRITCPVLVLYGYQDYEPITQAYLLKEHIKDAQVSFVNQCGHAVWLDQPDALFEQLDDFLSR